MKFAIFLQHYFPYGGLQRDAVRLAIAAQEHGHTPTMVVSTWDGEKPDGLKIIELHSGGTSNHRKAANFADACQPLLASGEYDTSICFSRVPNCPFHFCGDPCYLKHFRANKSAFNKLLPRYRYLLSAEADVFGPESTAHIFFLAAPELDAYQKFYQIQETRTTILPPWLISAQSFPQSDDQIRADIFKELKLADTNKLLLFVGSNFKLKRVSRIIEALPALNDDIHLAVCGDDDTAPLKQLANSLGASNRVHLMGPRNDIPRWMTAADILVHPSSRETAGMVLVEALTYGLPVACTQQCGYSSHVEDAGGILLSPDPAPEEISKAVNNILADLPSFQNKALSWAADPANYRTTEVILEKMLSSVS